MSDLVKIYDYARIDQGVADFIQRKKDAMIHRSVVNIVADGRDLLAIRQALGNDMEFRAWVTAEYWFSYVTAQKRMHVAEMVDTMDGVNPGLPQQFEDKTISELYELAAASRRPQIEAPEEKQTPEDSTSGEVQAYDLERVLDLESEYDLDLGEVIVDAQPTHQPDTPPEHTEPKEEQKPTVVTGIPIQTSNEIVTPTRPSPGERGLNKQGEIRYKRREICRPEYHWGVFLNEDGTYRVAARNISPALWNDVTVEQLREIVQDGMVQLQAHDAQEKK